MDAFFTPDESPMTVKLTRAYARLVKNKKDGTKQDVVILLTENSVVRRALAQVEARMLNRGQEFKREPW